MTYQYRNRKGDVYFLQAGNTRTGKPNYYFGRKLKGAPVQDIPQGYEVFESPERAQVFLRKQHASVIPEFEREIVVAEIMRSSSAEFPIVTVEDDSLVVYLPNRSGEQVDSLIRVLAGPLAFGSPRIQAAREEMIQRSDYQKMLRFQLVDDAERLYVVHRWCFRGSVDDWIWLDGPDDLSSLAKRFTPLLGSESFFDLI